MITEKYCKDCKVIKSVSLFNKEKNVKDGFRNICKSCQSIRGKIYTKNRTHGAGAKQRQRLFVLSIKSMGCGVCQEKNPYCIDFHHTSDDKEFCISEYQALTKKLIEEIQKCILLCANCHRKHHAGQLDVSTIEKINPPTLEEYFKSA